MKIKRLKPNVLRVMRIKEAAIRELVYETIIEKSEFIFDLLDLTTVHFEILFDMNERDLICVLHDSKSYWEHGPADFSQVSSLVEETTTTLYSKGCYVDLELNDGVLSVK